MQIIILKRYLLRFAHVCLVNYYLMLMNNIIKHYLQLHGNGPLLMWRILIITKYELVFRNFYSCTKPSAFYYLLIICSMVYSCCDHSKWLTRYFISSVSHLCFLSCVLFVYEKLIEILWLLISQTHGETHFVVFQDIYYFLQHSYLAFDNIFCWLRWENFQSMTSLYPWFFIWFFGSDWV